jgi:hypothetical protein
MGFGTLLAAWPSPRRRSDDRPAGEPAVRTAGDGGDGGGDDEGSAAVERVPTGVG